jgi:hypothetical protein
LLDQRSAGTAAKNELDYSLRSPALANALRQADTARPTVQGQGLSATAPSIVEALGAGILRDKGNKQLLAQDERARALRGEIQAGDMAAMQQELQQAQYQEEAKNEAARVLASAKLDAANKQQESTRQLAVDARSSKIAETAKEGKLVPMRNPVDNKIYQVRYNDKTGVGTLDGQVIENLSTWSTVEKTKPAASRTSGYSTPTTKERAKMSETSNAFGALSRLEGSFKDGYGTGKSEIPYLQKTKQRLARNMPFADALVDTSESVAAGSWFADYRREHELVQRHILFGSALTNTEKELWEGSNITENMSGPEIRRELMLQSELKRKAGAWERLEKQAAFGADNELVEANYPESSFGYVSESAFDERLLPALLAGKIKVIPDPKGMNLNNGPKKPEGVSYEVWFQIKPEDRQWIIDNPEDFK